MPEWPEILQEPGPTAWRTAYRVLGNHADADDCLQEACLAALQFSRRHEVKNWPGLLVHLATARAVDRLRDRRRRPQGQTADWAAVPDRMPPPAQRAEDEDLAQRLRAALARLTPT
jgi:RNA polymerase sigma-70 factor (ECF subfamily)